MMKRVRVRVRREALVPHPEAWVRCAFLSDLNAALGNGRPRFERIAIEASAQNADIVLFGGNYVRDISDAVGDLAPLCGIRAHLGKYFILGSRDYRDDPAAVREFFRSHGVTDLTNAHVTIMKHGRAFHLSGIDDATFGIPSNVPVPDPPFPHVMFTSRPENAAGAASDLILTPASARRADISVFEIGI